MARPSAVENYAHVKRLLGAVDENEAALRRMNVDPDRVRLQLAFSDTHKDLASQDALARRLFPAEYASGEAGQRSARFKALLLHEEPAIEFFREYLNTRRGTPEEAEIEGHIRELEAHR